MGMSWKMGNDHCVLGMTPPSQGQSTLGTGHRKAAGSPSLEKFKPLSDVALSP